MSMTMERMTSPVKVPSPDGGHSEASSEGEREQEDGQEQGQPSLLAFW